MARTKGADPKAMASLKEIRSSNRSWALLLPVSNLVLEKSINHECWIQDVAFITVGKISRRAKRLLGDAGILKRLQNSRNATVSNVISLAMKESDTIAIVRRIGTPDKLSRPLVQKVQDACALLSLSQLVDQSRSTNLNPSVDHGRRLRTSLFLSADSDEMWSLNKEAIISQAPLRLNKERELRLRGSFFPILMKALCGNIKIKPNWRKSIRNAAVLAGQSQASCDLAQSFLWNMIAIELLLTSEGDTYSRELPKRARAFLGWVENWELAEDRLGAAYKKRCELVHHGDRDGIEEEDVLFSDNLLLNIFENIMRNIQRFNSKKAIIDFSEQIAAERVLGIKRSKIRPSTLTYHGSPTATGHYEKIKI